MGTVLGSSVGPLVVHKGRNGEPCFPVVLPCGGIKVDVLFYPLVLAFCKSVSLWVEHGTDILSYA